MSNTEVRLRIGTKLKKEADRVFSGMGMTMPEAIRIFLTQSVNSGALPFRPHLKEPNALTLKAFNQAGEGEFEEFTLEEFKQSLGNDKKKQS